MELVCRSRYNCPKEACLGNYFLQLVSPKNKNDRVGLQALYPNDSIIQNFQVIKALHSSEPPPPPHPFFKGGVNFNVLPRRRGVEVL